MRSDLHGLTHTKELLNLFCIACVCYLDDSNIYVPQPCFMWAAGEFIRREFGED